MDAVSVACPTNLIGMSARKSEPLARESSDSTCPMDALCKTLPRQVDPYTKHSGSKHVSGEVFRDPEDGRIH